MRKIQNEQGYALLIVLFLVVFIMAVSAVFIRGSLGNAKQEIKVDESHLTVMAAEAGVDYYKTYVSNLYFSIVPDLEKFIQEDIKKQLNDANNKAKVIDYNKTRQRTTDELERVIKKKIEGLSVSKNIGLNNFKVATTSVIGQRERYILIVEGVSVGKGKGKESEIKFEQSFLVPDIQSSTNNNGVSEKYKYNGQAQYPNKINAPVCAEKSLIENEKCISKNESIIKMIKNSTVYLEKGRKNSLEDLTIDSNSVVYAKDSVTVKELKIQNNSVAYLDKAGDFEKISIVNSFLGMRGSISGIKEIEIVNGVFAYSGSFANYSGRIILTNSTMCLEGAWHVTPPGKVIIGTGSKLYVWGSIAADEQGGQMISDPYAMNHCSKEIVPPSSNSVWPRPEIKNATYR